MPFATEHDVRLRFQFTDAAAVPADLIEAAVEAAHERLMQRLLPGCAADPPAAVLLGETLLAGAEVLRSLAAREAAARANVRIGGQQVSAPGRFADLMLMADAATDAAWHVLADCLLPFPAQRVLAPTASVPVLGEAVR